VSAALLLVLSLGAGQGGYTVAHTGAARAQLLGEKDDAWKDAQSIAWGPTRYETRFRALWNESGLFVRFEAQDADPWWTMTKRDEWLWQEEVVEVFLDVNASGRDYAEVEISPGNVICDVRMVSPWPNKQMDYSWNLEGIESRVYMTRDASRHTTGWTAVAFMPWSGFRSLPSARDVKLPPEEGERWRFNAFRVERPHGKKDAERDAVEVAWSPSSEPSFHVPAAFRDFVFQRSP
jgi:hypothetical protein